MKVFVFTILVSNLFIPNFSFANSSIQVIKKPGIVMHMKQPPSQAGLTSLKDFAFDPTIPLLHNYVISNQEISIDGKFKDCETPMDKLESLKFFHDGGMWLIACTFDPDTNVAFDLYIMGWFDPDQKSTNSDLAEFEKSIADAATGISFEFPLDLRAITSAEFNFTLRAVSSDWEDISASTYVSIPVNSSNDFVDKFEKQVSPLNIDFKSFQGWMESTLGEVEYARWQVDVLPKATNVLITSEGKFTTSNGEVLPLDFYLVGVRECNKLQCY
jgi:hypothetical protein